jgi:hypothetical protein
MKVKDLEIIVPTDSAVDSQPTQSYTIEFREAYEFAKEN